MGLPTGVRIPLAAPYDFLDCDWDHFPDDEGAKWNIDCINFENGMYVVDASPVPHVGYEKIRFYMRNPSIDGVASADCWENGE